MGDYEFLEEDKEEDFTEREYFLRWKVLLGVIGSIVLLCWWNARATYLVLPTNSKMFFITIMGGTIFWGMFWYIKFNWNPSLSLSHLQPKKAIGLFLALCLGFLYTNIIYYSFAKEFAEMPLGIIRNKRRISSYKLEEIYWFMRFSITFFLSSQFLEKQGISGMLQELSYQAYKRQNRDRGKY